MGQPLRILSLEDVRDESEYPAPARALSIEEVEARAMNIWAVVRPVMGDAHGNPKQFFGSVQAKQTVVIELGDNAGFCWVYQLEKGDSAAISFAFCGDWRGFADTYGPPRAALRRSVAWIMDSFELFKLRAFIAKKNRKACAMAERMGFQREGTLRKELKKGGRRIDMCVYGLLLEDM